MWFVYVKGLRGPEPQKWSEEFGDVDRNGITREFLQKIHLPRFEMDRFTLDELVQLYPYEGSYEYSTNEVQGYNKKD